MHDPARPGPTNKNQRVGGFAPKKEKKKKKRKRQKRKEKEKEKEKKKKTKSQKTKNNNKKGPKRPSDDPFLKTKCGL